MILVKWLYYLNRRRIIMKTTDYPELHKHWIAWLDAEDKLEEWFNKHCKGMDGDPNCKWRCGNYVCPYSRSTGQLGESKFEYKGNDNED